MKPKKYINKDGSVTYYLRAYVGQDSNGKKQIVQKSWKPDKQYTPKQLEKELIKQQLDFEKSVTHNPSKIQNMTFKQFSDKWITQYAEPNLKQLTVSGYKSCMKRINEAIGHIKLDNITPIIINSFLLDLKESNKRKNAKIENETLSPKTVKNYYILLSAMFNTAIDWKLISENPVSSIKPPKVPKNKIASLDKNEVEVLFEKLNQAPLKYQLMIKLIVFSGMRKGEVLGLKWDCVDFVNNLITIENTVLYASGYGTYEDTPKTENSFRTIKLSDHIFELLKNYKQEQNNMIVNLKGHFKDEGYVFNGKNGGHMGTSTPSNWFSAFLKRNCLNHIGLHQLRHTTATLLIMEGVNIKSVSSRLGHSSTSTTTNIYTSYLRSADAMVSDALDDVLNFNKKNE